MVPRSSSDHSCFCSTCFLLVVAFLTKDERIPQPQAEDQEVLYDFVESSQSHKLSLMD